MSIDNFEEALLSSRDEFISRQHKAIDQAREQFGNRSIRERKIERPSTSLSTRKTRPDSYKTGYIVRLAVRSRRLAIDEMFEYRSDKLSKLEAQLDAEKAARKAGYPIIGYVYSIEKL